jgi:hypothetical protein
MDHVGERDSGGVRQPEDNHAERITHEDEVDTGFIQETGAGVVIGGEDGETLRLRLSLTEVVEGVEHVSRVGGEPITGHESDGRGLIIERGEKVCHGFVEGADDTVRPNVREGLKHKAALMKAGMRDDEVGLVHHSIPDVEDIEIDGPRLIFLPDLSAPELFLDGAEDAVEIMRPHVGLDLDHGVQKGLGAFGAVHGCGFINSACGCEPSLGHPLQDLMGGPAEMVDSTPQIRTERDAAGRGSWAWRKWSHGSHGSDRRFQTEHILHVVETGSAALQPLGSADGSSGEGISAGCFVGELDPLPNIGKDDGVISHDVSASECVDADLFRRASADVAHAAMPTVGIVIEATDVSQNLDQGAGGATRRIFFEPVVHLDDLQIKRITEELSGFPREPEEGVHSDTEIRGQDNR